MLIGAYRAGWSLSLVLFGLHLLVVGFLFARSNYLPRWLGWILMADGLAWVVDRLSEYVAPAASLGFLNIFFIGGVTTPNVQNSTLSRPCPNLLPI
jgi:hypothetical protein